MPIYSSNRCNSVSHKDILPSFQNEGYCYTHLDEYAILTEIMQNDLAMYEKMVEHDVKCMNGITEGTLTYSEVSILDENVVGDFFRWIGDSFKAFWEKIKSMFGHGKAQVTKTMNDFIINFTKKEIGTIKSNIKKGKYNGLQFSYYRISEWNPMKDETGCLKQLNEVLAKYQMLVDAELSTITGKADKDLNPDIEFINKECNALLAKFPTKFKDDSKKKQQTNESSLFLDESTDLGIFTEKKVDPNKETEHLNAVMDEVNKRKNTENNEGNPPTNNNNGGNKPQKTDKGPKSSVGPIKLAPLSSEGGVTEQRVDDCVKQCEGINAVINTIDSCQKSLDTSVNLIINKSQNIKINSDKKNKYIDGMRKCLTNIQSVITRYCSALMEAVNIMSNYNRTGLQNLLSAKNESYEQSNKALGIFAEVDEGFDPQDIDKDFDDPDMDYEDDGNDLGIFGSSSSPKVVNININV